MYICHVDTRHRTLQADKKRTKKPSVPYVWSVLLDRHVAVTKMGTQILFVSPQIVHPEILGVIPQTKMLKNFEVCQSEDRKTANLQWLIHKSRIFLVSQSANLQGNKQCF